MVSKEELEKAMKKRKLSEEDRNMIERELLPNLGEEIHPLVSRKKRKK